MRSCNRGLGSTLVYIDYAVPRKMMRANVSQTFRIWTNMTWFSFPAHDMIESKPYSHLVFTQASTFAQ